jgi:hypothetical protein
VEVVDICRHRHIPWGILSHDPSITFVSLVLGITHVSGDDMGTILFQANYSNLLTNVWALTV